MNIPTNVEKLKETIEEMKITNFHISWGPYAYKMTEEERAGYMLELLEEERKWKALSVEEKMRQQITEVYGKLKEAIKLTQYDISKFVKDERNFEMTEDRRRIHKLFGYLDMAIGTLGNWVSFEDKIKIKKDLKKKLTEYTK